MDDIDSQARSDAGFFDWLEQEGWDQCGKPWDNWYRNTKSDHAYLMRIHNLWLLYKREEDNDAVQNIP